MYYRVVQEKMRAKTDNKERTAPYQEGEEEGGNVAMVEAAAAVLAGLSSPPPHTDTTTPSLPLSTFHLSSRCVY